MERPSSRLSWAQNSDRDNIDLQITGFTLNTFTHMWVHSGPSAPTQTGVISTEFNRREKIIRQIHSLNHCCMWLLVMQSPRHPPSASLYILVNCNLASQLCLPLSPAVISSPGTDRFSLTPNLSVVEVWKRFPASIGQWNSSTVFGQAISGVITQPWLIRQFNEAEQGNSHLIPKVWRNS